MLHTLRHLPVTTKNQLEDSKVLSVVTRWVDKAKPAQEPPENAEPADSIEGTVVTEADSAPCETEDAPGGVAEGVAREDEGSCEAEARESSSATESQGGHCVGCHGNTYNIMSLVLSSWLQLQYYVTCVCCHDYRREWGCRGEAGGAGL